MKRISVFFTVLLLLAISAICASQQAETAWQLSDDPGCQAEFVQTDILGNVYVVEQDANLHGNLKTYDMFGDLIRTIPFQGLSNQFGAATGLLVNPSDGTAVIVFGTILWAFDWNGNQWLVDMNLGIIAKGMDYSGRALAVAVDSQNVRTDVRGDAGGADPGVFWYQTYIASSAFISPEGYVVLCHSTGGIRGGTFFVDAFDEYGNPIWTQSFGFAGDEDVSLGGFTEDDRGNEYLVINTQRLAQPPECYVICLDVANLGITLFTSQAIPGKATMVANGGSEILVAGETPSPFLAAFQLPPSQSADGGGAVLFNVPQAADAIAFNGTGPVVELYNSSTKSVDLIGLSPADGSVQTTISEPAATQANEGPIVNGFGGPMYYAGVTGGAASTSLLASIDYGANLFSVVVPSSVQGGTAIPVLNIITALPATFIPVTITSNIPSIVPTDFFEKLTLQQMTFQVPTNPVDSDTVVTLTATENNSNIRRFAPLKITTAALANIASSASSLGPSATATGMVTLNGPAGPSGKVVALSSNNAGISVPSSVKVPAGKSTATFTITSHAVSGNVSVSIKGSLGNLSVTTSIALGPASLKSLTLAGSTVVAGTTLAGSAIIATEAGPLGDTISLHSSSSAAVVPNSVVVPSGGTVKGFSVETNGVSSATSVTLTAAFAGISKTAELVVEPAALSSVVVSPTSVVGGQNAGATVHLSGKAGPTGYTVALKSSSADVTVPATLTFPANSESFSFVIKTKEVTVSNNVKITVTLGAVTRTAVLTLTP